MLAGIRAVSGENSFWCPTGVTRFIVKPAAGELSKLETLYTSKIRISNYEVILAPEELMRNNTD